MSRRSLSDVMIPEDIIDTVRNYITIDHKKVLFSRLQKANFETNFLGSIINPQHQD